MTTQAITKVEVPALPVKEQQENQRIEGLIAQFSIVDAETYVQADDWGRELKRRIKVIDALFDPLIESAKRAKSAAEDNRKTLVLARDRMAQSLESAEEHLNRQVSSYRREQQRKQQEEQAKRDAEERERVQKQRDEEAAAARAKGREKLAQVIEAAPIEVHAAPVAAPELPKTGSSLRTYWKFVVQDPAAVPREWCCPDEKKIGEWVRQQKERAKAIPEATTPSGAFASIIPGVEVYPDDKTSW